MNVLSLFDGMSCGQIALNRAGIKYDKYYASEIDKFAIKVTQKNYPDTIQLGDITTVKSADLPIIDLLIGGSPCQGFSFAGKQLKFEDPRSKLFFEYVRLLKECQPKYFLLENVRMAKDCEAAISTILGELYPESATQQTLSDPAKLEPIKINSALVSAQNRKRLYWTNIPGVQQPEDKGIYLKDILDESILDVCTSPMTIRKKSKCVRSGGRNSPPGAKQEWDNVYNSVIKDSDWRKLTPTECARLQTVDNHYLDGLSNSRKYKLLGNGWTVDVIAHIFKHIRNI